MEIYLILGLLALLALYLVATYNRLIARRNEAQEAFNNIDVYLKQRYDLIPNLVNTVKGYSAYESGTLERIVQLRQQAMAAPPAEKGAAEAALSGALRSVFALAENYPDLKASAQFGQLQETLANLEENIQRARRFYNATVRDLNTSIESFPTNLFAGPLGFSKMEFFDVPDHETANVDVRF
jgi:LemA protein